MKTKSKSLNVQKYIANIERPGWEFIGYHYDSYRFKGAGNVVEFSLRDLRDAFKNGW
jgi:hypothetical protein